MAFKKFSSVAGGKTKVNFEFVDYTESEAQRDGSKLYTFVLKNTIPLVVGRRITDDVSGEASNLEASDVSMIQVGSETLAKMEQLQDLYEKSEGKEGEALIDWKSDNSGVFTSNTLKLDVSANLEVWLVETSLANYGRKKRAERTQTQKSAIMAKIEANKAKRTFAGTPAVTTTPETKGKTNPEPVVK